MTIEICGRHQPGRIAAASEASEAEAGSKTPSLSFPRIEDCCLHLSTYVYIYLHMSTCPYLVWLFQKDVHARQTFTPRSIFKN